MKRGKNDTHWMVFYWKAADRIVAADHKGLVEILSCKNGVTYFTRERPPSRTPKTLVFLGYL